MKQPKMSSLKINKSETKKIRSGLAKKESVKITINIDAKTLSGLRLMAEKTDIPYQRLMNRLLKESLDHKSNNDSRLDRIEKELKKLKAKIAA